MYKGTLTIELTNEKTGEKEIHKDENMVTNAVAYVLGIAAQEASSPNNATNDFPYLLPVGKRALGGIFLFDGPLEEDADNVHFPMDVHLTGHAGQVANTTGKLAGSINTAESGKTDNGYVNVWDFSTSQANGTIQSMALTHYMGGQNPFQYGGLGYYAQASLNHSESPLFYDEASGDVFFAYQGKIYRKHMINVDILVNSPTYGEEVEVFDFAFSNPSYSNWSICNGYDGYIYAIYTPSLQSKGTATIRIRKVKVSDLSFQESEEKRFQMTNVTLYYTTEPGYNNNAQWAVSGGYLYCRSYSGECIYKVNLSNTADVEEIKVGDYTVHRIFPRRNGGLYASVYKVGQNSSGANQTYYYPGIVYPDGEYRLYEEKYWTGTLETYSFYGHISDRLYMYRNNGSSYICVGYCRDYLGTICNLSSPVVKTSAQSMKVTYTLTDVGRDTNE